MNMSTTTVFAGFTLCLVLLHAGPVSAQSRQAIPAPKVKVKRVPSPPSTQKQGDREKAMAYSFAKNFVTRSLKADGTAKFPPIQAATISRLPSPKQRKYRVAGYVDVPSTFGRLVRTTYVCQLHQISFNGWQCDNLATHERRY